ncbi:contact-dependent growth inhibition system immunity protein [Flavobacterium geliluteum]|uniref:CdiI family contact-dependent growth inhibition immunity protein n=1 Tax=Flavobacterium geliluteum TaxID=2816120 RepID=A0A940XHC9_9FLAO|nr:contact-dependent growth inhibition system immunity protein [Flavobacterium geliluteum]MBP4139799.1 CdiI family contact-dependent growth inhibition immunity protein [Flavobacterium geliluteum]
MIKSVSIKFFSKENKYIIYPQLKIKGFVSIASSPYFIEYNLSSSNLLEKILDTLKLSREIDERPKDWKEFRTEYLKGIGVKTMKALHNGSISLDVSIKDDTIIFMPWENKGSKEGFVGFKEDLTVKLPFNSLKEDLIKALELALSRCK